MEPIKTSVIIIGAGPTGLMLAAQLQRYGIDFMLLDRNPGTSPLSKAMIVHARSLEILDQMELAQKAIQLGRPAHHITMLARGKARGSIDLEGSGNGLSKFPFALILEQSKTENLLADHIRQKGAVIHWSSEVLGFEDTGNGVSLSYKDASGVEHLITADYLVGCDGASSFVRHQLGLSFSGDTQERMFYVADVKLKSEITGSKDAYFAMIKRGFVLFFPMAETDRYRVIGSVPDEIASKEKLSFTDIKNVITQQLGVPASFPEEYWFSTYKVHSRMAGQFRKGRCFIAGDAAHIHTPAGGQGMNTGLQDAYNLAWKLAFAVTEKATDSLLDTYDSERTENAKHLLKTTDRMFDLLAGTGALSNFLRLYMLPFFIGQISKIKSIMRFFFKTVSQIGIKYPESPLTLKSSVGKIEAGDRFPYFPTDKKLDDFLKKPGYKLFWFGAENNQAFADLKYRYADIEPMEINAIPEVFNSQSDFFVVVRPDNYIAYIGVEGQKAAQALSMKPA
ncbi:FAD-dependent monooxygenase [Flavobacterium silvaticum]|uniref:NAD(P)-binding protein n=1 Tax=Flavobacterium silvaticum TaxID=1852020 RepID=A0A972FNB6_9FLAO|nr:FAD-dependent monooxygenase [Flavobacterium silvaticum]NMH29191.1 NAD(P)-binding protein [Flavobacterium silvaticum]